MTASGICGISGICSFVTLQIVRRVAASRKNRASIPLQLLKNTYQAQVDHHRQC